VIATAWLQTVLIARHMASGGCVGDMTLRESASSKLSDRFPFNSNDLHDFHATPLRHGAPTELQLIEITKLFRLFP
jgi:hypothetical protein